MVQVINRVQNTRPSFGSQILEGLEYAGNAAEKHKQSKAQQLQNEIKQQQLQHRTSYLQKLGYEDVPEEFQEQVLKSHQEKELNEQKHNLSQQANESKTNQELNEKLAPFQSALKTIGHMRKLRNEGNLGFGSSYSPFSKTRESAGKYSQLGKSLIQMASTIPIRNKTEFETLAQDLYDPNITDATANGILDAMEEIVSQGMQAYSGNLNQNMQQQNIQERPPLSQFER